MKEKFKNNLMLIVMYIALAVCVFVAVNALYKVLTAQTNILIVAGGVLLIGGAMLIITKIRRQ